MNGLSIVKSLIDTGKHVVLLPIHKSFADFAIMQTVSLM
jgi:hypothetical protein